jgi:acyl transferase domain-containing protein
LPEKAINVLYIKKLDDALKDGNPIQAVIRSTASNCDGKTFGLTQPSSQSHEELMRMAHEISGIQNIHDTAFVECRGTGTPTGDPLETQAVAKVFSERGIYIGSVRPTVCN